MSYNSPVHILQGGSVIEVGPSGTISILAGGSIQNAGGQSFSGLNSIASGGTLLVASGGSIQIASGGAMSNAGLKTLLSGGSFVIASGGSMQVAAGGAINVAGTSGFSAPAGITLGGTAGRWAFGTLGLASGVGSVSTGLTTVVSAWANSLSAVQGGAGSMSSAVIDPVNFANGSVIFRGLAGTLAFTGSNGTVSWAAFGV